MNLSNSQFAIRNSLIISYFECIDESFLQLLTSIHKSYSYFHFIKPIETENYGI